MGLCLSTPMPVDLFQADSQSSTLELGAAIPGLRVLVEGLHLAHSASTAAHHCSTAWAMKIYAGASMSHAAAACVS